jgi:hypothetical protein
MSTTSSAECHSPDIAAILEQLTAGRPLDPALVERVRAQAAQITAGIIRDRGFVDDETFQSLLDEET